MSRSFSRGMVCSLLAIFAVLVGMTAIPARAQMGTQGQVVVTVLDPSGAVIPGAGLKMENPETNSVRSATTQAKGTYTFVGLPIGTYRLTVTQTGFVTQVFGSVVVQAGRVTNLKVVLKVGAPAQQVVVTSSATPLIQTTSSAIGTTIDVKQLEQLPLGGRDVSQLAFLTPGFSAAPGHSGGGTWNGLPLIAQGNNINGVISSTSRMKFAGNYTPGVQARLEDIQEMTVQTGQLDLNQGFGTSAMQTNFVTRSGTNAYHGRVYEDFRNSALNANSWYNNAIGRQKNHLILNDFGGAVGGPILKNKLFFFGSFAESKRPGGYSSTAPVLTADAMQGIFTMSDGSKVNLFSDVAQPNGLPTGINTTVGQEISAIQDAIKSGTLSNTSDPNIQSLTWFNGSPVTSYWPSVRVDYNMTQSLRIDFAWNDNRVSQPNAGAPPFPGSNFSQLSASNKTDNYTTALGVDWTISPTLINQFRGGFYYNKSAYAYDAKPLYLTEPIVDWGYARSGQTFHLPVTTYYPIFNFSDNVSWQHGSHAVNFGISWYREQDHYYNPPDGIPDTHLGLANGDPALNAFENYFSGASSADRGNAEQLYAILVGRIASVSPSGSGLPYDPKTGQYSTKVGAYNLDELSKAWGLYFQDAWRMKPTLTVNYGLRWDFTGDNHDLTSAYHSADPIGIFGPSGVGNVFQPGNLPGTMDPVYTARSHQYNPWNVSPQPSLGLAWNPQYNSGLLGKLTGGGKTVFRAGFSVRRFTEPYQYFWNAASNYGFAFYQYFSLSASNSGALGTFAPGSLALGDSLPPYYKTPTQYAAVIPESSQTWFGYWSGVNGMNYNIRQPYVQQWNVGIQRELGSHNALEIRYLGSHTVHQWIQQDPNEVNVFENGFLTEFTNAQKNMAINAANGITSFADNGYAGQVALPIFDAAFAGEASGGTGVPMVDYGPGRFITYLNEGAVGSAAATLDTIFGAAPYFCNLVGSGFGPCASQIGYNGAGAGYPINFFQANPFNSGKTTGYLTDAGYGNYNALQIDFRQKPWHGMQFDANYSWSHTMGAQPDNQWTGNTSQFTLRNQRLSYGPTLFDIRQVMHISGTYDLPFGNGKRFLSGNKYLDKVVGGWSVGTILTYQTGAPVLIGGGYRTFNSTADGGVLFNGLTAAQLQSAVGVFHIPGASYADGINPTYLSSPSGGGANSQYLSPNSVPGTFGMHSWIYGPHFFNDDIALTKAIPIHENIRFTFQAEFLNAFNHPNWAFSNGNIRSYGFGLANVISTTSPTNPNGVGARQIELRANIEF